MSEANRQQVQRYLDSSWGTIVKGISERRHISIDSINAITNKFDIYTTKQFCDWGFFDGTFYEDEMLELLKKETGTDSKGKLNTIGLNDYRKAPADSCRSQQRQDCGYLCPRGNRAGTIEHNDRAELAKPFVKCGKTIK